MTIRSSTAMTAVAFTLAAAALPSPAASDTPTSAELSALRAEVNSLRAAQAARAAEMQRAEDRIAALEASLARFDGSQPATASSPAPAVEARPSPGQSGAAAARPRLAFSGDFRVRYEDNSADGDLAAWDRGVLRARLRAGYELTDRIYLGAMLSTGDVSNPRTGDVTLTGFDADLTVKLAQVYARAAFGRLQLAAGKLPQPFQRTELVWDGDVNPQGVAAAYKWPAGRRGSISLTGLYFLVDEASSGADSDMIGGQLAFSHDLGADARLELAAAYYDYALGTTPGASPAAFRGNLVGPDGGYLSDFNLVDGMVAVTYNGFGERWPLRVVGDYVRNAGAAVDQDTGAGLDLLLGRATQRGDWRLGYGYSEAGVDAVLAAFSHDNTTLATNYLQHTLTLDYMLSPRVMLNATAYHYRPLSGEYAGARDPDEWLDRFRLNLQVTF